jgi:hypothetical protein
MDKPATSVTRPRPKSGQEARDRPAVRRPPFPPIAAGGGRTLRLTLELLFG